MDGLRVQIFVGQSTRVLEKQAKELVQLHSDPLFGAAQELLNSGETVLEIRKKLEGHLNLPILLTLLDCITSQKRFEDKFEHAPSWLLTRSAAEQATDSRIARWRANTLAQDPRAQEISELGCGIGGDSVYFAKSLRLQSYESDPARATLARDNIRRLSGSDSYKVSNEVKDLASLSGDILFADPARRDNQRLSNPEQWTPPLSSVLDCYRDGRFRVVAVKCAPGLRLLDHETSNLPMTTTFISVNGQLKEAYLLIHKEQAKKSRALIFDTTLAQAEIIETLHQELPLLAPRAGLYLHNPNPAILRSQALDTLGQQIQAGLLHPKIGYLVGPRVSPSHLADSFMIDDHFPLNWGQLKKWLGRSEWTEYEYLGRGVPFSQTDVRKRLPAPKRKKNARALRGSLVIYRTEGGYHAILGRRSEKGNAP